MSVVVPGTLRRDARPPIEMDAAPAPGAADALRPTVLPRRIVRASLAPQNGPGHDAEDPAVRRFWTALIGPGAVADLLRLMAAAATGRAIKEPPHLHVLVAEGLAAHRGHEITVRSTVPYLEEGRLQRLRPALRTEYRRLRAN